MIRSITHCTAPYRNRNGQLTERKQVWYTSLAAICSSVSLPANHSSICSNLFYFYIKKCFGNLYMSLRHFQLGNGIKELAGGIIAPIWTGNLIKTLARQTNKKSLLLSLWLSAISRNGGLLLNTGEK